MFKPFVYIFFLSCLSGYFIFFFYVEKIEIRATFPIYGNTFHKPQIPESIEEIKISFSGSNLPSIRPSDQIYGWYWEGSGSQVVYYFHGNGGALRDFYSDVEYIHSLGYSVMAYDYPGYGESTGIPSDERLKIYSNTFYNHIKQEKGISDKDILVWGYSVGTAVSTQFISEHPNHPLILMAPFSSKYEMGAKYFFGYPPQKLFFHHNYLNTLETLKHFQERLLIIHGTADEIVPYSQGRAIFKNTSSPEKYFITLPNAKHNGILKIYGASLKPFFTDFLEGKKIPKEDIIFDEKTKKEFLNSYILQHIATVIPSNPEVSKPKTPTQKPVLDDLYSRDDSYTKFVSQTEHFQNLTYTPSDLQAVAGGKISSSKNMQLRTEALTHLMILSEDFFKQFGANLQVVSAYRSYQYQLGIQNGGCGSKFCAKAGYSEHQTGLAVDLFETTSNDIFLSKPTLKGYFQWLQSNAYQYGFHNSYQKGAQVDGYEIEPWHWRYVGIPLATELWEQHLTFSQFMKQKK